MNRLLLSLILCGSIGVAAAFGADSKASSKADDKAKTPPASTQPADKKAQKPDSKPINQYCAVNHGDKVDPKVTTIYMGKTIGFCCESCIDDFKKDPAKYMKDLK